MAGISGGTGMLPVLCSVRRREARGEPRGNWPRTLASVAVSSYVFGSSFEQHVVRSSFQANWGNQIRHGPGRARRSHPCVTDRRPPPKPALGCRRRVPLVACHQCPPQIPRAVPNPPSGAKPRQLKTEHRELDAYHPTSTPAGSPHARAVSHPPPIPVNPCPLCALAVRCG